MAKVAKVNEMEIYRNKLTQKTQKCAINFLRILRTTASGDCRKRERSKKKWKEFMAKIESQAVKVMSCRKVLATYFNFSLI